MVAGWFWLTAARDAWALLAWAVLACDVPVRIGPVTVEQQRSAYACDAPAVQPFSRRGVTLAARLAILVAMLAAETTAAWAAPDGDPPKHGIAMHGEPLLPASFDHFAYANPDAPKGGRLVWGVIGTFDSLNPLIVKGIAVPQIRGYVFESLLIRGRDEPFTLYGLLADTVQTDDARDYVTFHLRPEARFSDGHPVTSDDVVFSWRLLKDKSRYRSYYSKVSKAEALDGQTVRFDLSGANDRELALVIGLMPILPKHAIDVGEVQRDARSLHRSDRVPTA